MTFNNFIHLLEDNPMASILLCGTAIACSVIFGETYNKADTRRHERELPDSYWEAKKAEAEAQAKIAQHKADIERELKLDNRNREDERYRQRLEFEKTAPVGYWQEKIAKEESARAKAANESNERIARERNKAMNQMVNKTIDSWKE